MFIKHFYCLYFLLYCRLMSETWFFFKIRHIGSTTSGRQREGSRSSWYMIVTLSDKLNNARRNLYNYYLSCSFFLFEYSNFYIGWWVLFILCAQLNLHFIYGFKKFYALKYFIFREIIQYFNRKKKIFKKYLNMTSVFVNDLNNQTRALDESWFLSIRIQIKI